MHPKSVYEIEYVALHVLDVCRCVGVHNMVVFLAHYKFTFCLPLTHDKIFLNPLMHFFAKGSKGYV